MKTRLLACLLCVLHTAYPQAQFRTTAGLVVAPVRVTDKEGKSVDGLKASDFELYDNGVQRSFELDTSSNPISVVVAIQSSAISGPALAKIRKIGSLIQPLIAGERGQAAVLTYSDKIRLRQDFTSDPARITAAFRDLEPDGGGAAMHAAIVDAVERLAARDNGHRRVLILIGESRDRSSNVSLEEAITKAQAANVVVYPVSYSAYWTAFTSKGAEQFDSGAPVYQPGSGTNLIAVFREIGRAGSKNGHEALARYTGGMKTSFVKLKGLEQVLLSAGEDIHSQYLLSFASGGGDGAAANVYHSLSIRVRGCPECQIRHRPGYWRSTTE